MRRIRFVRLYRMWNPGQIAELDFPVAEQFVRRGIAEWADSEAECATVEAPENTMRKPVPKRRARKRKAKTA